MSEPNITPVARGIGEILLDAFAAIWPDGVRWHIIYRECGQCGRSFPYPALDCDGLTVRARLCTRCLDLRKTIAIIKPHGVYNDRSNSD